MAVEDLRRKISFRLYPTPEQEQFLSECRELHRELYNAALQERIECYKKTGQSIGYVSQANMLPAIKVDRPELVPLGSHALQATLKRLDRAFQAFFGRVEKGQTPGHPRFKSKRRFDSFTYPDPAGWSLTDFPAKNGGKNARTHLIRVGTHNIRARGMCRFERFEPNDLTIKRVGNGWMASVTVRVSPAEARRDRVGSEIRAFDQGVTDRLVFDDGETFENPRWLREKLGEIERLQQCRARCKRGSRGYRKLSAEIARTHRKIANCRKDWMHKTTTALVERAEVLATEKLKTKNMTRAPKAKPDPDRPGAFLPNGAAAKAGLNREILSAGFAQFLQMCAYKAEEAGTRFHVADTQRIKPTQRCACCGHTESKTLEERVHLCGHCGFMADRDRNAALVCLIDALSPGFWLALEDGRRKKAKPGQVARISLGPYAAFIRNRVLAAAMSPLTGEGEPALGTSVETATCSHSLQETGNPHLKLSEAILEV